MKKLHFSQVKQERRKSFLPFLSVFLPVALRYLYFGFQYFPQLDDYIQYHNYAASDSLPNVIRALGLLAARPLAGLLDVTLWSWLWPCMILSVLLLSAAYAASAILFRDLLEKYFGASGLFVVFYALMPLGIEGTYWVSASSRIVLGLLFVAWAATCFSRYLESGSVRSLVGALVFQFLTFCLYEQTAVLSCALHILLALLVVRERRERAAAALLCVLTAGAYFGVCALAGPSPLYDGRTNVILPISAYYFDTFLPELLSQLKSAFLGGGWYILSHGLIRGILQILSDGAWLWCALLLLCTAFFAYIQFGKARQKDCQSQCKSKLLVPLIGGLFLAVAPLAPFFIISNPWFSFRGTVTSFVGLALIGDVLLRLLLGNRQKALAAVGGVLTLLFCVTAVSELADYKTNYEADQRIVAEVAKLSEKHAGTGKIAILNLSASYVPELNCLYHEHVVGVTESTWALTGAVRCYNNSTDDWNSYVPIPLDETYAYLGWEYNEKTLSAMDAVYAYDAETNTLLPIRVSYAGDGEYLLYREDDSFYGRITEIGNNGIFSEE